jgi:AcrR family transcriptional regulator
MLLCDHIGNIVIKAPKNCIMPRGFTDREKDTIQEHLLKVGRERFARYGLRKTNIEELTREAGISKGAFYLFYDSKEALYFDVMARVEAEIQADLLDAVKRSGDSYRESFRQFLHTALDILQTHPFFANASSEDYRALLGRIPEEQIRGGIRTDEEFVALLIDAWRDKGLEIVYPPRIVSALLRSLVFVSLHRDDYEPGVYEETMNLLVDMAAERLTVDTKDATTWQR